MWYILLSALSLILMVLSICMVYKRETIFCYVLFLVAGTYFLVSVVVISTNPSLEMLKKDYIDAKYKCEILKTDGKMPLETILDFKKDIEDMNTRIDNHRKYHKNWYLKPLFYREIAELDKLNCDTINVEIVSY